MGGTFRGRAALRPRRGVRGQWPRGRRVQGSRARVPDAGAREVGEVLASAGKTPSRTEPPPGLREADRRRRSAPSARAAPLGAFGDQLTVVSGEANVAADPIDADGRPRALVLGSDRRFSPVPGHLSLTRWSPSAILDLAAERVMAPRNTYRYRFIVDGRTVHIGITIDLARRELEHRRRWPDGRIQKVGRATTHEAAWRWEREQRERGINATT